MTIRFGKNDANGRNSRSRDDYYDDDDDDGKNCNCKSNYKVLRPLYQSTGWYLRSDVVRKKHRCCSENY